MEVHVLIATIPTRRRSCAALIADLHRQSLRPDRIHVVLDGYGAVPFRHAPSQIPVSEHRLVSRAGPGGRWRVVEQLPADTVIVVLDDDIDVSGSPGLVEALSAPPRAEPRLAAAASGMTPDGRDVCWGAPRSMGPLIAGNAGTMALRAQHAVGLGALRQLVMTMYAFDPLGDLGDDEALLSVHLWRQGVAIEHVPIGGMRLAEDTQQVAQSPLRVLRDGSWDAQRRALCALTGWPWPHT